MEVELGSRSPGSGGATALLHDARMMQHCLLWDNPVCAIEVPERLSVVTERLAERGLTERCLFMQPRHATPEDILLVHSAEYLALVESTESMSLEELKALSDKTMDAFFHPDTYACARLALGATLQLVDAVVTGAVRNGVALVRPPGHHSQRNEANGFCIFNNVAIAAERAKRTHGLRRILIVDWDIHHGQGTQFIFEDDPSVLYFSWHRYEHAKFWPNLRKSEFDCVGNGPGAGFNLNLPWNEVGMGNGDYLYAFLRTLLPVAYEFDPELVIVSAGFDSAIGDPEGMMSATPECFAHLTQLLGGLAGGRLCIVLEGGYNLCSLAESMCFTVQTLLGDPVPPLSGRMAPHVSAMESVHNLVTSHAPHWGCFRLHADPPELAAAFGADSGDLPWHHQPDLADPSVGLTAAIGTPNFNRLMRDHVTGLRVTVTPIRTAVSGFPEGSDGAAEVAGCATVQPKRLSAEQLSALLRGASPESAGEGAAAQVCGLLDQVLRGQVRNGAARVPTSQGLLVCASNYARQLGAKRTLLLSIGAEVPASVSDDGDVLVLDVQGAAAEPGEPARSGERHLVISWPEPGEGELLWTLLHLLLPMAYEFRPDLLLLVLGDASDRCQATARMMGHVTLLLQVLAAGRVVALVTEAGDPSCSTLGSVVRSLQGRPPSPPTPGVRLSPPPTPANLQHLRGAVRAQGECWAMLRSWGSGGGSAKKQLP
ncbi:polyamine deacetylase HDAC10 isoform X1 [Petromyzon marinus]|uniref:polyamine deacetylase HDAC10 isoform X1 n=1 Tax=Petromyzon marinus TaxID=7757 RepID=UPI003F6EFF16